LQAWEAVVGEAFAPLAHGVPVAVQFAGDLLVGGLVGLGGTQDDATAEGQCLRRGAGAGEGLQLVADLRGQKQTGAKRKRHASPPCPENHGG
jgi:hypothetical protein